MALINVGFDDFINLENQWRLAPLYIENGEGFKFYMLMEAQVFSTFISLEDIRARFGDSQFVIELFRSTYLHDGIKINSIDFADSGVSKDIKIDASDFKGALDSFRAAMDDFKKFTMTATGGQGTAGYALIPTTVAGTPMRRCEGCGNIILSGETRCPACGSERLTDKDADMTILKWVGWDFMGTVKYILKFLEKYRMSQITDVNDEEKLAIKGHLISSVRDGWTLGKLENEIDMVVGNQEKARMIARTEIIRSANEGALLQYKEEKNADVVKWLAVPSAPGGRTCPDCLARNGREYLIKDAQGKIPLHPFCRCCWLPVTKMQA
jgi:SPP1 gp7 family putative phage head morphogenesis protein